MLNSWECTVPGEFCCHHYREKTNQGWVIGERLGAVGNQGLSLSMRDSHVRVALQFSNRAPNSIWVTGIVQILRL